MKTIFVLFLMIFAAGESAQPAWLQTLPEMEKLAATDDWAYSPQPLSETQKQQFSADFAKKYPEIRGFLTPAHIRDLSRWAKDEMKTYDSIPFPDADKLVWQPVRRDAAGTKILLETTLDTLPTHSPLVTRWLKLFAIFDTVTGKISVIAVTIRGELLE